MRSLLFAALAACLVATAAHATADRPNIVLILIDDLGWKDLGCTGSTVHRTPNLDRLASRGTIFDQAYASAPNCAPTRACLMTGLWTPRHGVYTVEDSMGGRPESRRFIAPPNDTDLDPSFRTIAEMFKDAGYATGCVGKWNLGQGTNTPHSPTGQGFDEFRHYKRLGFRNGYFDGERYSTDVLFDETIDVARRAGNRPFFIFLAPDAVHTPLAAPEASIAAHPDIDRDRATYAAMVEHVDQGIGRLVAQLPENTIIVFTSDNGGDVSDNTPLRADKGAMYEGGIRVPLIVAGPGVRGGRRSTTPCQSIDLVPTLLDLCDVAVPTNLDGRSLADELRGGDAIDRTRLHWHFPAYIGRNTPSSVMREGHWKIIESLEDGSVELYDLASDPGETTDLAEREPARTRVMLTALKSWQRETNAPGMLGPNPDFEGTSATRGNRGTRGGREVGGIPRPRGGAGRGQRRTGADPPAERGREATPPRPNRERRASIPVAVYADNWFELHINGRLVAIDPIEFTPHNVVRFEIVPDYPMTIAVQARDFADPKTGLEYEGTNIGDGGFIMSIGDSIVTDEDWKVRTIHHGPIGRDMSRPRVRASEPPANWTSPEFDDSSWSPAIVHARERVRPNADGFDEIDWHDARFIWDGDLDLDNTVLFRTTIDAPPSSTAAMPPEGRGTRRPDSREARPVARDPDAQPWLVAHAPEIDRDGDDVLEREELEADLAVTLRSADRDRDGRISSDEYRDMRGVRSASAGFLRGHFDEIDSDGDGSVSSSELRDGFDRMFRNMDTDRDGRIDAAERQVAGDRQERRGRGNAGGRDRGQDADGRERRVGRGRGGQRGGRRDAEGGDRVGHGDGNDRSRREAGFVIPETNVGEAPPQVAAFREITGVDVRWDKEWIYVQSNGMPDHPMMVGIRSWNQQVPIPHAYRDGNAFRIPRNPIPSSTPTPIPFDGPVAVAINGVPIFNPIKQDGRTDTRTAGELDRWGGHAGRGDDYHYHVAPMHLAAGRPSGSPVAFALDGYPILGPTDLAGRRPIDLDGSHGHEHPHPHPDAGETWLDAPYHYHGSDDRPPYVQASFHGEVDLENRPNARGIRPFTQPLRGAIISGFEAIEAAHWRLTYTLAGDEHVIDYRRLPDGSWQFEFIDPDGEARVETYPDRRNDRARSELSGLPDEIPQEARRPTGSRNRGSERPRSQPNGRNGSDPPNIILLLSDDQGWNGLSVPMKPGDPGSMNAFVRTPRLAELAERGMRISNGYAPAPVCSPTRASIQTGRTPGQLHWTKAARSATAADGHLLVPPVSERDLDAAYITIGEILKQAGYTTAHFGKWHLSGGGPGAHGYDAHDGDTGNADAAPHVAPNPVDIMGMTIRAEDFIEAAHAAGKPFFVQMSYHALHYPQNASPELIEHYRAAAGRQNEKEILRNAMAEELDTGVGRLIDHLDDLDITDNTYVIYMSDNGGGGSGGRGNTLRGGKGGLWEGGIRVPFIIQGPGIPAGSTHDIRITGTDLLPTFAAIAGSTAPLPEGIEGGDFLPVLIGDAESIDRPHDFLTFHFPHYQGREGPQSAIIRGDLKLVKDYETDTVRLFDLTEDPGESTDLARIRADDARRLQALLETHLDRIDADLPVRNPEAGPRDAPRSPSGEGDRNRGGGRGRARGGAGSSE